MKGSLYKVLRKSYPLINIGVVMSIAANGNGLREVTLPDEAHPVDCPGCEQGKSPGGPQGMARYLPSRFARALSRSRLPCASAASDGGPDLSLVT